MAAYKHHVFKTLVATDPDHLGLELTKGVLDKTGESPNGDTFTNEIILEGKNSVYSSADTNEINAVIITYDITDQTKPDSM